MNAYFWDQRLPHVVKLDIERRTGALLERDRLQTCPLTYKGKRNGGGLELRLESSTLNGTLYSLRLDAARNGPSEARFREWIRNLGVTEDPGAIEYATGDRYEQYVKAALDFEEEEGRKREDPAATTAAQHRVLDALRAGKRYRLAEGGPEGFYSVEIRMENGVLVKREVGEQEIVKTYSTRDEMLALLRSYFLVAACKDTFPHKPPEAEIWRYIGYQLK